MERKATDTSDPPRNKLTHKPNFVTYPVPSALDKTLPTLTITALLRESATCA